MNSTLKENMVLAFCDFTKVSNLRALEDKLAALTL
jgi:hypothetical protein